MEKERDLKKRTMAFAIAVMKFVKLLPKTFEGQHVKRQLFRSATSVAANYRSTCRGRSKKDFIAKLGTVIEEADESEFWLEFAADAQLVTAGVGRTLQNEAGELIAIFTTSQKTARARLKAERKARKTERAVGS